MDTILDKIELANYIAYKHELEHKESIGRIRLQKSLYFLFAYWIKRNSVMFDNNKRIEGQLSELDDDPVLNFKPLFNQDFQAWAYGPVDAEIYALQKENTFTLKNSKEEKVSKFKESTDPLVLDFIDLYLEAINKLNDFSLVDISHSDSAWKKHYDRTRQFNNERITTEDIMQDYANE